MSQHQRDPLDMNLFFDPKLAAHAEQYESRVFEFVEGQLGSEQAKEIEAHLAMCATCRELADQWGDLDNSLSRAFAAPTLPANFRNNLTRRMQSETGSFRVISGDEKRRIKEELQRRSKNWHRNWLRTQWAGLLDGFGYAAAAGMGTYAAYLLVRQVPGFDAAAMLKSTWLLPAATAVSACILLGGVLFAGRHQLQRWLSRW